MKRKATPASLLTFLAILAASISVASATPVYTIQEIGLTGTNYSYANAGGTDQVSSPQQLNAAGQAAGHSTRYSSSGTSLGQDTWFFNGSSTQQIGLTGSSYRYSVSGGTDQYSIPFLLNDAGQVIGYSHRYNGSGSSLGEDSWFFNGSSTQEIGLTGTNYSYAASGGTAQYSNPQVLNAAGQVIGFSYRSNSSGGDLGQDAWLYSGSSTQRIGLTGASYSYAASGGTYQYSYATQLNSAGQVAGITDRYSSSGGSLGEDSWFYNGSSTQQIGLTGTNYNYAASGGTYRLSSPQILNTGGQILGYSLRYNSSGGDLGKDVWVYNGSSSQRIGLSGANYSYAASGGTYQYSSSVLLNDAGQASGLSARYSSSGSSLGQDTWFYNGSSTQQIGLTGANYSYAVSGGTYQLSSPSMVNPAGKVIGYSSRYNSSGGSLGLDTWFYNGSSTQQIGLTGTNYSYAASGGTYEASSLEEINSAGQVLGYSSRYNSSGGSLGRDGWFFDPATDTTSLLQFSVESATNFSETFPVVLTDTGVVLGTYELYSGSSDEGTHLFYWSESNGFSDLGSLVNGTLTAHGWQSLIGVLGADGSSGDGSPLFIAGEGLLSNQTGGYSAYLMSQVVPEPAALSLLLVASGLLLRPRRKSSSFRGLARS